MFSYSAYILIGNNSTGKTSFQKHLLKHLTNKTYSRLPINLKAEIDHPRMPRGFETIFTMNRSYQEKSDLYKNVPRFFKKHFKYANICILSSHASGRCIDDVGLMIDFLRENCYNVYGVFFSNAYGADAMNICRSLDWDERLWVKNPLAKGERVQVQLTRLGQEFGEMLIARAQIQ